MIETGQKLSPETQAESYENVLVTEQALEEEKGVFRKLEQMGGGKMKRVIASLMLGSALVFGAGTVEAQSFPNAKKMTVEDQLKWQAEQKAKGAPGWQESGPIVAPVQKQEVSPQQSEKYKQAAANFWRDVGLISGPLGNKASSENERQMADQCLKVAASIILG